MKLYHQEETRRSNGHHSHEFVFKKVESLNWWIISDGALAPKIKRFPSDASITCVNKSPGDAKGVNVCLFKTAND